MKSIFLNCPRACRLAIIILASALAPAARAQESSPLPDDSPAERRAVIRTIADHLEASYVIADVANEMAISLRERVERGDYDSVGSAEELAQQLTDDLRAISHDGHLRLRYHADPAQVIPTWNRPTSDSEVRNRKRAERTNHGFTEVRILPGNIGYLRLDEFGDPALGGDTAAAAMRFVAGTDALIIDLRQNGGGGAMGTLLATYLLGTKPAHLVDFVIREKDETIQVWTLPHVPGPLYSKPTYILVGPRTASAAESFAYMLRNRERVELVGQKTAGAANPGGFVRVSRHLAIFIPNGRPVDPLTGTNWEGVGIAPDVETDLAQALEIAHRRVLEKLLSDPAADPEAAEAWREAVQLSRG